VEQQSAIPRIRQTLQSCREGPRPQIEACVVQAIHDVEISVQECVGKPIGMTFTTRSKELDQRGANARWQ
jgi:hypothetical protein